MTGEWICLISADCWLIALSNASGPSSKAPVIWPRSAILHNAAASMVDCICGLTSSTAAKMATLGCSISSACAKSIAFCKMSFLVSKSGTTLSAQSVKVKSLWYVGLSINHTWLIRRSVRRFWVLSIRTPINSSVCTEPLMIKSACCSRTIFAAISTASWLCSASTNVKPEISKLASVAAFSILCFGPTKIGVMMWCWCAWIQDCKMISVVGCTTTAGTGETKRPCAKSCESLVNIVLPLWVDVNNTEHSGFD